MRRIFVTVLVLGLFGFALQTVSAQTGSNVIANGLNNPRGLYYDENGVLWISEAGTAGDLSAKSDLGPIKYGGTAQVLMVPPGKAGAVPVLGGLPSSQGFDDIIGVNSVFANKDGLWLVNGLGPNADPLDQAMIGLDSKTYRIKQVVDMYGFEAANNPDKDVVMSDPVDVAQADDGTYYIADASGNDLLTWTPKDGLKLFHVWLDLPVPTSVDIGQDGSIYVGFLSPFPYDPGSARIEKWSPDGKLLTTYSGLTAVTDVLVGQDGTLYAVEMASTYGDLGWVPGTGSVVSVTESGTTPVAENLNFPYRLAQAPEGGLAVTINSAFSDPNSGEVIALTGEIPTLNVQPPVSTAEVSEQAPGATETPEVPVGTPEVN